MKNGTYILTIAIPTYNRGNLLRKCIESIVCDVDFNAIQLVISDNCSSDNTTTVVKTFQNIFPNIKYNRNATNIGLEANLKKAIELSDGQFIKVINDYIVFYQGGVSHLFRAVNAHLQDKTPLFFLNKETLTHDRSDESFCANLNDFVSKASYWSTWISCFGVWKEDYHRIENKEKHFGFLFYHTSILFELIKRKHGVFLLNEKFFNSQTVENKGGYHILVFIKSYLYHLVYEYYVNLDIDKGVFKSEKRKVLFFIYPYIVTIFTQKKFSFEKNGIPATLLKYYKNNVYFYCLIIRFFISYIPLLVFYRFIKSN